MNETRKADSPQVDAPPAEPAPAAEAAPADRPEAGAVIAALNAENTALKDKALRTMAEMENLRRRTDKEVADARAYGASNFARDMLSFADNMQRALEAAPKDADGVLKTLIDGLALTAADFQSRLGRHGVKKMEPLGQKFDPNLHEALFEAPDPSVPTGTVVQLVEDGYTIGERMLRPAKVGVSRGGPKAGA